MKNDGSYILRLKNIMSIESEHKPLLVYSFTWQGLEFFVHRPWLAGLPLSDMPFWEVSEKSTGYAVGDKNIATINEAQKRAIARLEIVGLERVKEKINKIKEDSKV